MSETTQDMETMEAGRVMDCRVAELMGWEDITGRLLPVGVSPDAMRRYGAQIKDDVPRFSTSIADAWRVVERMAEGGLSVVIATNGAAPRQNGVKVFDSIHGIGHEIFDANEHPGWYAVAETVPLAICRVALQAVAGTPPTR